MNAKNAVIAVLALATVGGAALAWRQYQELVELRAAAMNSGERAEMQKRIADLLASNRELEEQLAAMRALHEPGTDDLMGTTSAERPAAGDQADRGQRGFRGRGGEQMAAMRELMAKPEVQALVSANQKAALENRYGALFRSLNLPPEQLDKLETLLLERQNTTQDVLAAAREQGLDPRTDRENIRKLITDAQSSIDANIKSVIGDNGFAQLTNYEQTMPQRNLVNALQQRLSYASNPLSASQADQLVQILAANPPPARNNASGNNNGGAAGDGAGFGGRGGGFGGRNPGFVGGGPDAGGGGFPGATAQITAAAIEQAQTVLAQPQLDALQQMRQQQQTAQQLQRLIRTTLRGNNAAAGDATANTGAGRR